VRFAAAIVAVHVDGDQGVVWFESLDPARGGPVGFDVRTPAVDQHERPAGAGGAEEDLKITRFDESCDDRRCRWFGHDGGQLGVGCARPV
jgi:hypothetical protein